MKFLFLSEKNFTYKDEEGKSGDRPQAFVKLEAKLKLALVDLRYLKSRLRQLSDTQPTIAHNNSQASNTWKVGLLPNQQLGQHRQHQPRGLGYIQALIIRTEAEILEYRKKLERQGVYADESGTIDWHISKKFVVYDNDPNLRKATKLDFRGSLLYYKKSQQIPFDTRQMVTLFSGQGKAMYVITQEGHIHVGSHVVGHRHHSSLVAGEMVAGAGEIEVKNGKIIWLSNKSGHYRPNIYHLCQTLHILQKKGVTMDFKLQVHAPPPALTQNYPNVGDFLRDLNASDTDMIYGYEFAKLLQYEHYLTDSILGKREWRWEIGKGVFDRNGNKVDHKTVRKWLKLQGYTGEELTFDEHSNRKVTTNNSIDNNYIDNDNYIDKYNT